MKTISSFVEEYIKTHPFLQSALADRIINLSSLARMILPEIELHLGKGGVQEGAVIMALKRLSINLEFRLSHRIIHMMKKTSEIIVKSQITDYTFLISDTIFKNQILLLEEMNGCKDIFYTSSRGTRELNIIISNELNNMVEGIFKTETRLQKLENLSAISIKLPEENIVIPGIYYFIFQKLAWEGIIINEVVSTSNEFTILVNELYVDKAFKVINDLKKTN